MIYFNQGFEGILSYKVEKLVLKNPLRKTVGVISQICVMCIILYLIQHPSTCLDCGLQFKNHDQFNYHHTTRVVQPNDSCIPFMLCYKNT